MPPFRHHLLVCTQEKPDGVPACSVKGGPALLEAFRARIEAMGASDQVLVTSCGCLGICERGPNVVVHPEGRWHTSVGPDDVEPILQQLSADGAAAARAEPDGETIRREVREHRNKVRGMMAARAKAGVIPEELLRLVRGFQPSRAVLTAVELDLFTHVGRGATAAQVAQQAGTDPRATASLLNVLVSFGLLRRAGEGFELTEPAASYLTASSPHDARAALLHSNHLWRTWSTLTECVRQGTTLRSAPAAQGDEDWTQAFIAAMHKIGSMRAPVVTGAIDFSDVAKVLDLGGGSGAYSIAFARTHSEVHCTVFDLPAVLPLTRSYVDAAGLTDRIHFASGDLHADAYGSGFDLVFVSAICHMMGPDENQAMLRKVAHALRPGGRVVIQDYILNDDGTGYPMATLFSLNMLVGTKNGSSYSGREYLDWLNRTGFTSPRVVEIPGPTGLVVATRS
jgi:(2Fe-2S) ferredoxin/SAM-dependent methyltransferase